MPWQPRNSVVVPIDFSDSAPQAIRTALELVDGPQHLKLLHVLVPLDAVSPGVAFGELSDASRETHVRDFCDKFFTENNLDPVELAVRVGHPGEEIVEYAQSVSADLIVVPSHGYHGLKRFVLGSVAEQVIRHAGCDVLVLRRTDAE